MSKKILVALLLGLGIGAWLLWPLAPLAVSPRLEIWVLDVGQGESVLVREPSGKKLLFDGGPNDTVLAQIGEILPPWDRHIDVVVLSHPHADHIRGLISVLDRYTIGELWTSGTTAATKDFAAWTEKIQEKKIKTRVVQAGLEEPWGQAELEVHHPLITMAGKQPSETHDGTVVVRVEYQAQALLLTGDLEEEHELAMLQSCQQPKCTLASQIMQIPHHGSAYGLAPEFLAAVHPQIALIPVGKDNKFKHPRPEILEKLKKAQVIILRTDTQRQLHLFFQNSAISAQTGVGDSFHVLLTPLSSAVALPSAPP